MHVNRAQYSIPTIARRETAKPNANEQQNAAVAQRAGTTHPARGTQYSQTTYELVHLLNMARPEDSDSVGSRLVAPGMALALTSPTASGSVPASYIIDAIGPRLITADERAQGIIDQIGGGDEVDLLEAQAKLLWQSDTHQTNDAAVLQRYFKRLDRDGSGGLSFAELRDLIVHYDRTNSGPDAPILPSDWK